MDTTVRSVGELESQAPLRDDGDDDDGDDDEDVFNDANGDCVFFLGTFPYWEWGLDCGSMDKSPVFDGSEYSLGGNGEFVKNHRAAIGGAKPGTGGGCLKKGPFSNFTLNIGPSEARNPLAYNPRCYKRDLNDDVCHKWASLRNATELILYTSTISVFQSASQGEGVRGDGGRTFGTGVHSGGHYSISGDPGSDFHFSALEPGFYLHHGNLDRLYFIWQNLNWEARQVCIRGAQL